MLICQSFCILAYQKLIEMKILVSWLAFNNDFSQGKAIKEGPTYSFHENFFAHDKHYILSSSKGEDIRTDALLNLLNRNFKGREIEVVYLNISDVINLNEIRQKVEKWMNGLKGNEIDIFISPGTPTMQTAWYFIHMGMKLKTSLYQTRAAKFTSKKDKPELIKVELEQSPIPTAVTILESEIAPSGKIKLETDYNITDSIKPVYERALKIAHTDDVTALILGESGTGKEHLANYIHKNSSRKDKPFLTINCSAINDQLLESRLFGYKKGAFTGANVDTKGLFEEADGGSILLDEIGDISPFMQQSLLRVLQQKEIQPVGGKSIKIDVRVICATNKDLPMSCKEGKFRWDLYYRMAVAELHLPQLVERGKEELKEMISFFNKSQMKKFRRNEQLKFDKEVMDLLLTYHYPGNIRELENMIASMYVFNESKIKRKDLPSRLNVEEAENPLTIAHVEKELIKKVLQIKKGNQAQTQIAIGYGSINTLKKKIIEYKIKTEEYE
jgi:DNA-binding NtrC family response regulator